MAEMNFREIAERVARHHGVNCWHVFKSEKIRKGRVCTCGRDAEVVAIAAALKQAYEDGRKAGISETIDSFGEAIKSARSAS